MAKPRPIRTRGNGFDDDDPYSPGNCTDCSAKDPHQRAQHHLSLLRHMDLDYLRDHLTEQYVKMRLGMGKERPDVVDDICIWAANIIEQFSHMVDVDTGAPLQWWEARQYMLDHRDAIAARAYLQAPAKYRTPSGVKVREIVIEPNSIREPGEEDVDDWPEEEQAEAIEVDPEIYSDDEANAVEQSSRELD